MFGRNDQDALPSLFQADVGVDPFVSDVDIVLVRQGTPAPGLELHFPTGLEAGHRGGGGVGGLGAAHGTRGLGVVPVPISLR